MTESIQQHPEEHPEEHQLSTADMAAAAEPKRPTGNGEPAPTPEGRAAVREPETRVGKLSAKTTPLLSSEMENELRSRWDTIQAGFVDEPRKCVEEADNLVAELMKHIADTFADERSDLEHQWVRGDQVSTEDLRVAMQHYRQFFDRLLSM